MEKLIKFYNKNRYIVWIIILILVAIIVLIQILNRYVSRKINIENAVNQNKTMYNEFDNNYSIITDKKVKEEVSTIIDEFINYCNEKQVEKAYGLLSNECKEILYPTLNDFTEKYYSKLFNRKITYGYQAWTTNSNTEYTYKVDFVEDMLATGTASNTSIIDYYTVVNNNGKYELNINKFIGIKDINKTETKNNITININRKRTYMDYETYEIVVQNKTNEILKLDALENTNTVYLENNKGQKYYWYSHEVLEEDIEISKSQSKKIEIKINKNYQPKNETTKLVFSNITLNKQRFTIEMAL